MFLGDTDYKIIYFKKNCFSIKSQKQSKQIDDPNDLICPITPFGLTRLLLRVIVIAYNYNIIYYFHYAYGVHISDVRTALIRR